MTIFNDKTPFFQIGQPQKYLDSCCAAKIGAIEYTDTGMLLAIHTPEQLEYSKSCYPEDSNSLGNDVPRIVSNDRAQEIEPLFSSDLLGLEYPYL